MAYSSTLKIEVTLTFNGLHGFISQKIELLGRICFQYIMGTRIAMPDILLSTQVLSCIRLPTHNITYPWRCFRWMALGPFYCSYVFSVRHLYFTGHHGQCQALVFHIWCEVSLGNQLWQYGTTLTLLIIWGSSIDSYIFGKSQTNSQPRYWLFWLRFLVVVLSPTGHMLGWYFTLSYNCFLSNSLFIKSYHSVLCSMRYKQYH
jgi:hypothetical protein